MRCSVVGVLAVLLFGIASCGDGTGVTRTTSEGTAGSCLRSLTWPDDQYVDFIDYDAARRLGILTADLDLGPFDFSDRAVRRAYGELDTAGLRLPGLIDQSIQRAGASVIGVRDVRCAAAISGEESVRLTASAEVDEAAWTTSYPLVHIDDRVGVADTEDKATALTEDANADADAEDGDARRSIVDRLSAEGAFQGFVIKVPGDNAAVDWSGLGLGSNGDDDLFTLVWYAPQLSDAELSAVFDAAIGRSAIDKHLEITELKPVIADGWLTLTATIDNRQLPEILRLRGDSLFIPRNR